MCSINKSKLKLFNDCLDDFENLKLLSKINNNCYDIFNEAYFYFENYNTGANRYYYVLCIKKLIILSKNYDWTAKIINDLIKNIKDLIFSD